MEFMQLMLKLLVVVFVTTSMATLGLTLRTREIVGPWRRFNLVLSLLFSNLVLVPAIAYCFTKVLVLDETFETGLLLLGMAAGAPFVPKLIEVARADMALAVSMMLLQVLGTIILLPFLLPRLIPGVQADALQIATPLILQMLLPLIAGLVFRHLSPSWAKRINPPLILISQLSALIVLIALFVVNFRTMTAMLGSGALLAALCFVMVAMLVGYFTSLVNGESSVVQTIATGQRNIPAALVVASSNPLPGDIIGMLMLTTFVGLIPIVGYAIYSGRHATKRKSFSDS